MLKKLLRPGLHWLGIFIPVSLFLEARSAAPPLVFFTAALSIIPVARLISVATEQLAHRTGDSIGALLNATFGNAPELIISIVALHAGFHEMVLASLVGALLANLLLAMGVSFFAGGLKWHQQEYNPAGIKIYSSMMMIAVISLAVPSAYHAFSVAKDLPVETENTLNLSIAAVLLVAYGLYLYFMIGTHPDFFKPADAGRGVSDEEDKPWPLNVAIMALLAASVLAAFLSEILVSAAEGTGEALGLSDVFIGIVFLAVIGGFAESFSAILMAVKNKMDLSIGIALGSSIQIALFVAPSLVILSLFIGPGQMNLSFNKSLMTVLFLGVLLGAMISGDGRSNWYKGVQLILVYIIIALKFYFVPSQS